jgi:tetratricopeptide (TPR) repeat protein
LSKRFAEHAARPLGLRSLTAGALALTLAACGSSTPRQADIETPREVTAPAATRVEPAAAEVAPTSAPEPERKRDRRADRRAAEEANADAAAAAVLEPVPEAAAASYERAVAAMRAKNWVEAELELEQLVLEHPEYPGPHVNLALVYLNDGRRGDARKEIELALGVDPGHAAANTQLGILLREDGKFEAAEAAYRRALETDPNHALAHYNLGVLLDIYLRRTAEALEHYEAYQATLSQPDETVGRWIIDLRRRAGTGSGARVAQGEGL